jgi:PAS domain S-box-containing protein
MGMRDSDVLDGSLAWAIFDSLPSGIVVQGLDGTIASANPAAEKILGLTLNQMLGVTSVDPGWRALHPDGSNFPGDAHPAMVVLRSGQTVRNVVMGVFNPQAAKYTWINVHAIPIIDSTTGSLQGAYSIFEDITRRQQAERALTTWMKSSGLPFKPRSTDSGLPM